MNTADVLKEYLVSIGFSVNNSSLNQFQRALSSASGSVDSFTGTSTSGLAKAALGFTSFIVTVNAGISKYLSSLGQADLQTQIFARRMWMSTDAARAYQGSMKALGASLQDLYLSPELMQRYLSLRSQALGMQMNDKDYETAMKGVRDMTFEFQRLKLEGTYALQWIGYYLTKYIDPVLKGSSLSLKDINNLIQQKMPEWTQEVAQIASWFVRLGAAAWDARGALAAIMGIMMAPKLISLATNPVFLMIAGLTTLLLLLDDYNAYENDKSGKSSVFTSLWKSMDDNGAFKILKEGLGDTNNSLKDLLTSFKDLGKALDKSGAANVGIMAINSTFKILGATLTSVAGLITIIAGGIEGISTHDWSTFQKGLKLFTSGVPQDITDNLNKTFGPWNQNTGTTPDDIFKMIPSHKPSDSVYPLGGISKTSYSGNSGFEWLSSGSQGDASWSKRIYDILSAYIPQIASVLGVKFNGSVQPSAQSQLSLTDFVDKMNHFMSNAQSGASLVNYSPWQALYGGNTNTSHSTQVNVRSSFSITGAKDPDATARTVNSSQTQLLTRAFKGVQV